MSAAISSEVIAEFLFLTLEVSFHPSAFNYDIGNTIHDDILTVQCVVRSTVDGNFSLLVLDEIQFCTGKQTDTAVKRSTKHETH